MIGPKSGFWVNGPFYKIDGCNKNYIVVTSEFGPHPFTHVYAHRIEATMTFMTENWNTSDRQKYWENFSVVCQLPMGTNTTPCPMTYCGYGHIPSNAQSQYDYSNKTYKKSSCVDWKNFPNFTGQTENLNCDRWNCSDKAPNGWEEFWFGSLPRSDGEIDMISRHSTTFKMKKNWWYYLLYPENAIQFRQAQLAVPTPTPSGIPTTPRPTLTNTPPINTQIPTDVPTPTTINNNCLNKKNGDADCNNSINLADFNIWRSEYSSSMEQLNPLLNKSDFNADGNINLSDFNLWRSNYFKS